MRVHELARELGVSSKDILLLLEELGVGGKTASSTVPADQLPVIRARLGGAAQAPSPPVAPAPPPKPPAAKAAPRPVPSVEPAAPPTEAAEAPAPAEETGAVTIKAPLTVADYATALDTDTENVISAAATLGETVSESDLISAELALLIGESWGYTIQLEQAEVPPQPEAAPAAVAAPGEPEGEAAAPVAEAAAVETAVTAAPRRVVPRRTAPPGAPPRPPVVTVMGHVDHGKTTLLDAIRQTNVVAEEAGAITQHIGAYQVEVRGRLITFIDTPGHEAFTAMRARGAQVTDVAVVVVAADDGVMPQTQEAIDHARAAGVPIVVAVNKIDRANASVDGVKQTLAQRGLVPEEWGGDTIFVPISALQKTGIEDLLEMILLVADMADLRAVRDKPAEGAVLEAQLDRRRGCVATLLVQEGTLHTGDSLLVGPVAGKVRAMTDDRGRRLSEAGPSTPVQVIGLASVPEASELFRVVGSEREARALAEEARLASRQAGLLRAGPRTMTEISQLLAAGEVKTLRLVLKADVQGSVEAISAALSQLRSEEVQLEMLHTGVGDITESDVSLAAASKPAVVVGFQVSADMQARRLAADEHIEIRRYEVIYDLLDDVRDTMSGMLEARYEEMVVGQAEVRALFRSSRFGTIAGCLVLDGRIARGGTARVRRGGEVLFEGPIASLRHLKDDVSEVSQGFECGIIVQGFADFEPGDTIECVEQRQVRRTLL
jgi:translation initiation factor IF-2